MELFHYISIRIDRAIPTQHSKESIAVEQPHARAKIARIGILYWYKKYF